MAVTNKSKGKGKVFGVKGAAMELRFTGEWVRKLADSGKLPCTRTDGGYRIFFEEDLMKFKEEREAQKNAERKR